MHRTGSKSKSHLLLFIMYSRMANLQDMILILILILMYWLEMWFTFSVRPNALMLSCRAFTNPPLIQKVFHPGFRVFFRFCGFSNPYNPPHARGSLESIIKYIPWVPAGRKKHLAIGHLLIHRNKINGKKITK